MFVVVASALSVVGILVVKVVRKISCKNSSGRQDNSRNQLTKRGLSKKWMQTIPDKYTNLQDIWRDMNKFGLESCNLIIGIDYTKSNEWTGTESYKGTNLHSIGMDTFNPYEEAIAIIAHTLPLLDEDSMIPCFGFGDVSTHDKHVFSFYEEEEQQGGLQSLLTRYRQITPHISLSGPTSFGPIIRQAVRIVRQSGCQYHVLLVIADGQVTRDPDTPSSVYSFQERDTMRALEEASEYPLSIIVVGVGDGPWEHMHRIDDEVGKRCFDNLQFVNFTEIMATNDVTKRDQVFALKALNEIPQQFRCIINQNLLGNTQKIINHAMPENALPPPQRVIQADASRDETAEKTHTETEHEMLDDQVHTQLQHLLSDKADLLQKVQLLGNENQSLRELLQYASEPTVNRQDSFYGRSNPSFGRQDSLYAINEKQQSEMIETNDRKDIVGPDEEKKEVGIINNGDKKEDSVQDSSQDIVSTEIK